MMLWEEGYPLLTKKEQQIEAFLNDVEIDIDSWPMIPTYLEIEGKSEEEIIKNRQNAEEYIHQAAIYNF